MRQINITLQGEPDNPLDANPHRPDLSLWHSSEDGEQYVVLTLRPMWGQAQRFIELTPDKARKLANALNALAQQAEDNYEPPDPMAHVEFPFATNH